MSSLNAASQSANRQLNPSFRYEERLLSHGLIINRTGVWLNGMLRVWFGSCVGSGDFVTLARASANAAEADCRPHYRTGLGFRIKPLGINRLAVWEDKQH